MSLTMTLRDVSPGQLMEDVYFQRDFIAIHAGPDPVDTIALDGFRHGAAVRNIPGEELHDLETPWGYGGPVALDETWLREGMWLWRQRQNDAGRVAEFIRLHPFLNPVAFRGHFDEIRFDRLTVLVDLTESSKSRRARYSKSTKYSLKQADRQLRFKIATASDAAVFKHCYELGLDRNLAELEYYRPLEYYEALLAAPWATGWIAEFKDEPVAAACFLHQGPFAHYHLAGGGPAARKTFAHYLLLDNAIEHFASQGCRWMHLGGGRDDSLDDSLFAFKRKFSPLRIGFYTAGLIFDQEAYHSLARGNTGRFLSYRFRPRPIVRHDSVTLREATPDDFLAYFRLKSDVDNIIWSGAATPPNWSRMAVWYEQQLAVPSGRRLYLAESEGRIIGYAYLDDRNDAFESTVAVAANAAGRGIGRAILVRVLENAGSVPVPRPVRAWIYPENIASVKAHEAAGFVLDDAIEPRQFEMPLLGTECKQYCWIWRPAATNGN